MTSVTSNTTPLDQSRGRPRKNPLAHPEMSRFLSKPTRLDRQPERLRLPPAFGFDEFTGAVVELYDCSDLALAVDQIDRGGWH